MIGIPFLVEADALRDCSDLQICWKVAVRLLRRRIPMRLVGGLSSAVKILKQSRIAGCRPAIFVINTFGANEILPGLDPLIGETPVLYLRRQLFAGNSGLLKASPALKSPSTSTTAILKRMTPRLASLWWYGSRNSDEQALDVTRCLLQFLGDGDFRHIEIQNLLEALER